MNSIRRDAGDDQTEMAVERLTPPCDPDHLLTILDEIEATVFDQFQSISRDVDTNMHRLADSVQRLTDVRTALHTVRGLRARFDAINRSIDG